MYTRISADFLELLVGIFILTTIFLPKLFKKMPTNGFFFMILGFLSNFLGMIVAVTRPFISSFFVLNNLGKERVVATKAACQGLTQMMKIVTFATSVKFDFSDFTEILIVLCVASILETFLGKKIMDKMSEKRFNKINSMLLVRISVAMIAKGV
jgi:uncharacterized protein